MARPAVEYQFTPVPNEALDRLAAVGLTGREFRVIFVVWRKTWGWSKKQDKIPMSQFARFTGIDRRKCHVLLKELIEKKIIKKSVAANGNRKTITYSFNDIYSEWRMLPPMGTKAKRQNVPPEGDNLSPSTATVLSPSAAHSIENDKNFSRESGAAPPGSFGIQGLAPPVAACSRCGKIAQTTDLADENGEDLCIVCFKKIERKIPNCVSQFTSTAPGG